MLFFLILTMAVLDKKPWKYEKPNEKSPNNLEPLEVALF